MQLEAVKRQIGWLLLVQLLVSLIAVGLAFWFSTLRGVSVALGAGTMLLGQLYATIRLLWRVGQHRTHPQRIVMNLYRGAVGKMVILGVSVYLCHRWFAVAWGAYIVGVAVVQVGLWLAPFWFNKKG